MRRLSFIVGLILLACTPVAFAQETRTLRVQLQPVITGPTDIAVGRTLVLDASASLGASESTEYRWYRDEVSQPISQSVEAVFTPEEAGTTTIRLQMITTVDGEKLEREAAHTVTVYERKVVLVADATVPPEKIVNYQRKAQEENIFLRILHQPATTIPLGDENALATLITEGGDAILGAEYILLWTDGISGLQGLMRASESDEDRRNSLRTKTIVLVSDGSLKTLARSIRGPFSVIKPNRIVLTRKEAIHPLFTTVSPDDFLSQIAAWDIDFLVVDHSTVALRPWNLISSLTNYMLTHGVASQTVILLLTLPVIATILAFLKQVVGITTFGLFTPSIIALSFMALGSFTGFLFLVFILITGYATRSIMKRYRLLYIPKVAIILTVVSFTLLLLLGIGAFFGLTLSGDTIFVLLIMSTLSESFLNVRLEEGLYSALLGIGETVFAAALCAFIVQLSLVQSIILAYPEPTLLLMLLINIFLGNWTGLRLVEYFRFREVFKHIQEE